MKTKWIVLIIGTFTALSLQAQIPEETPAAPAAETPPAETELIEITVTPVEPDAPAEDIQLTEIDELGIAEEDIATDARILGGRISLTLSGVELQDVIRLFSRLSNANIIVPDLGEEVSARRVDINLSNVEWQPALRAILDTYDLELYEKMPNTEVYSVREKTADAPEPQEVKTFKLDYATVDGVSEMIKTMIPEPGKLSVFPARNTIIVQSTAQNMSEIENMIHAVDLPREQVFIEAKFLELTDSASEQLGVDWQVLGGYEVGIQGISGNYNYTDSRVDSINRSRTSTESRYTDIAGRPYENLEELPDTPVLDPFGNLVNNTDYPARPGSFGPNDSRSYGVTPTILNETINGVSAIDSETVTRALGATLSASDFKLVLSALKETGGIKIVSNPKVIVANEETAQIYIGTKEPNIRQETTQVENTAPITTYNLDPDTPYFEYGIKLDVTPTVNTADNISVLINPSLKRLQERKVVGGNSYPVTREKTINTRFSLESGQTAAIGGLTESDDRDTSRKVPLLGNLPLIGRFFSYTSKSSDQNETIIFVTVGLANPNGINMETGLPQESSLAMKHTATMEANRQIKQEELRIFNQLEIDRAQSALQTLREAEEKRLKVLRDAEQKRLQEKEADAAADVK